MSNDSRRIQVLDGGMGTTMEKLSYDISSPLWGLEVLHTYPDAVREIHARFLQAGADIIETATYQLTPELLERHLHLDVASSAGVLRKAVQVASQARETLLQSPKAEGGSEEQARTGRRIALSFGPYGSTLQPGQEYGGIYPPPFGPHVSSSSSGSNSAIRTNALPPGSEEEEAAIQALAEHHLSKLLVFAQDSETWENVDWVGFETVPVLHEIKGIRRAMSVLNKRLEEKYGRSGAGPGEQRQQRLEGHGDASLGLGPGGDDIIDGDGERESEGAVEWWKKKFWIASPFPAPSGEHPHRLPSGQHATIPDVLASLLLGEGEIPDGIGINCTHPRYLSSLSQQYTSALSSLTRSHPHPHPRSKGEYGKRPTFLLYPDGGQVYDVLTRTWSADEGTSPRQWAEGVYSVAHELESAEDGEGEKVWGGVIVGGCCKTSFEEIAALRGVVDEHTSTGTASSDIS